MGSRNPDRISLAARRREGETVGQMHANGWRLQAFCPKCRVTLNLKLEPMIATAGPLFSLWDRPMICRNAACRDGRAILQAKAPGMAYFEPLRSPRPTPPPPAAWMASRGKDPPQG